MLGVFAFVFTYASVVQVERFILMSDTENIVSDSLTKLPCFSQMPLLPCPQVHKNISYVFLWHFLLV